MCFGLYVTVCSVCPVCSVCSVCVISNQNIAKPLPSVLSSV